MPHNIIKDALAKLTQGSPKGAGGAGVLLAGAGALIYGINKSLYTVDGGHRAIIFSRIGGIQDRVYAEGLHFRVPWFQYPIIYDIRAKPRRLISPTGSKDLQMVNIGLRVLARPVASALPRLYQRLGLDYDERVLPSICNEVLKSVVAQFNASQLITMRQEVSLMIRRDLVERAKDFDLILDDVSITDLSFSPQYTAAVESKQVAQQEAQRAAFLVERAVQERQQKIVAAEGEAKAATLLGEAMKENPGYLKLRRIEAARKIAQVIAQSSNKVYLNANNLLLNVKDTDEIDQALGAGMSPSSPAPLPNILSPEVSIDSFLAPSSPATEVEPEISALVPDDSWVVIDPEVPASGDEPLSTIKDTVAIDSLLETTIDENAILTEYIDKVSETVNETLLTVSEILSQEIPAPEDVLIAEETSTAVEFMPETLALPSEESVSLESEMSATTEDTDVVADTDTQSTIPAEVPDPSPEILTLATEESVSLVSEITATAEDTDVVADIPLVDVDTQSSIPAEEN